MNRTVVLIGVGRAGSLPELQAVRSALDAMKQWADSQDIPREHVHLLSDQGGGRVTASDIFGCIQKVCKLGTIEQLLVYFAGHGINKAYGEYWLLSDAPDNPNEAVNVAGSIVLARRCGIPHIVFISDACRTAPEGIRAQGITGTTIFPNLTAQGPSGSVDQFYACLLGDPAYEVRDPAASTRVFHAVYTDVLTEALAGRHRDLIDRKAGAATGFVRPWPLKRKLPELLSGRLRELNTPLTVHQTPDAIVCSDPERHWLARVEPLDRQPEVAPADLGFLEFDSSNTVTAPPAPLVPPSRLDPAAFREAIFRLGSLGLQKGRVDARIGADMAARRGHHGTDALAGFQQPSNSPNAESASHDPFAIIANETQEAAQRLMHDFGPLDFETRSGLKIRGETIAHAASAKGRVEQLSPDLVRVVQPSGAPAVNVLLRFSSGYSTVVPALRDYVASLSFENGRFVDLTYEPSPATWRWGEYRARRQELRDLRAIMAASSRFGTFRLDEEEPDAIIVRLRVAKHLDPSLALYAAYACSDLDRRRVIRSIQEYLVADLQLRLFDIALLADDASYSSIPVYPWFPLLSRGWPLLTALQGADAEHLEGLQRSLVPSLWTLFDDSGFELLSRSFDKKDPE